MKAKTKSEIKQVLRQYKKEAYKCLYPGNDYSWGTKKKNRDSTVKLMNKICSKISKTVWPTDDVDVIQIRDGNWILDLFYWDDIRNANLIYSKDDHTAWVREKNGRFVDCDIGGS